MSIKGSNPLQVGLVVGFLSVAILDGSPACAEDKTTLLAPYTEYVIAQGIVGAYGHKFTLATCPPTSVVVGGGFSAEPGVVFYDQFMFGNGWYGTARNDHSVPKEMTTFAVCLHNASGAYVLEEPKEVDVEPGAFNLVRVNCPGGSITTGGGFRVDSDGGLVVWENLLETELNTWIVMAFNNSGSTRTLHAYATCLWGSDGLMKQEVGSAFVSVGSSGDAVATCPYGALVTSGGFYAAENLIVHSSWGPYSDHGWLVSAWNSHPDTGIQVSSYVTCLTLGLIFTDGFESGDATVWSATVP